MKNIGISTSPQGNSGSQSHLNGHALADLKDRFEKMRAEWKRDFDENKGYVWTISIDGTSTINALGLANCDYTLHLSASHIGETMYGVYRGEMAFNFKGDMGGAKAILGLLGFGTSEDLAGSFKNNDFVMRVSPYNAQTEEEFTLTFGQSPYADAAPEMTGDPTTDAAKQAGYEMAMNFINSLTSQITSTQQKEIKKEVINKKASGLWYDWDTRMTSGDMSTYFKIAGGNGIYYAHGNAETDASGKKLDGTVTAGTILTKPETCKIDELTDSPFPYTIKTFPDGTVLFTLYSTTDPKVRVYWEGKLDAIDVDKTTVVK